jgi:hypothetical protein
MIAISDIAAAQAVTHVVGAVDERLRVAPGWRRGRRAGASSHRRGAPERNRGASLATGARSAGVSV